MPVEPLSLTASVIAVVGLTYDSVKGLNDTVKGVKNAPASLQTLRAGLDAFEAVLKPMEQAFGHPMPGENADLALTPSQQASLEALQPVLHLCRTSCGAFSERLAELTSHSSDDRFALRDKIRVHFNASDIRVLIENLAQGQRTLSDALGFSNLNMATTNQKSLDELAASYAQSLNDIGGRIQGIELSMAALSVSSAGITKEDVTQVRKVLEEHGEMLRSSLRVYQPALEETCVKAGTTVKYAQAFDQSRVFSGNIDFHGDAPSTYVGTAVARQTARIANGNMSGEAASNFWK